MAQLAQNHPGDCVVLLHGSPGCEASTNCTMSAWSQTCSLTTSGGANSYARMAPAYNQPQIGQQVSDQITLTAGGTEPAWYGVTIYAQSVLGREYVNGVSIYDIIFEALGTSAAIFDSGEMGPINWNPGPDIGNGESGISGDAVGVASSLSPGDTLAPGRALRRGPYTLTMKPNGNLVEEVAMNGTRFPVWSSGTSAPGARATLRHDANLVIRDRSGRARWSTGTRGYAHLHHGRLVVATPQGRAVWASGRDGGRGRRLTLRPNGELVLTGAGRTLWTARGGR